MMCLFLCICVGGILCSIVPWWCLITLYTKGKIVSPHHVLVKLHLPMHLHHHFVILWGQSELVVVVDFGSWVSPPSLIAQINSFAFGYPFVNIYLKDTAGQSANQKLVWFLHRVFFMIFFRVTPTLSAFVSAGTFLALRPQQKKKRTKNIYKIAFPLQLFFSGEWSNGLAFIKSTLLSVFSNAQLQIN